MKLWNAEESQSWIPKSHVCSGLMGLLNSFENANQEYIAEHSLRIKRTHKISKIWSCNRYVEHNRSHNSNQRKRTNSQIWTRAGYATQISGLYICAQNNNNNNSLHYTLRYQQSCHSRALVRHSFSPLTEINGLFNNCSTQVTLVMTIVMRSLFRTKRNYLQKSKTFAQKKRVKVIIEREEEILIVFFSHKISDFSLLCCNLNLWFL